MEGLVYINHGRVIVDCPHQCGNAYSVKRNQTSLRCSAEDGCGSTIELRVPRNLGDIIDELANRPIKATRNWFPRGHHVAERGNFPMGQSVSDLRAEQEMMEGH